MDKIRTTVFESKENLFFAVVIVGGIVFTFFVTAIGTATLLGYLLSFLLYDVFSISANKSDTSCISGLIGLIIGFVFAGPYVTLRLYVYLFFRKRQ